VVDEYSSREDLLDELNRLRKANRELQIENKYYLHAIQNSYGHNHAHVISRYQSADMKTGLDPSNEPDPMSWQNIKKYHIAELIDIDLLQQLFDSFYELTGIMHAFLDVDNNILSRTGWTDICLNFHRVGEETERRCKISDSYITGHLHDGPYIKYKCLNGLIDYATPIVVEGQHLATIYMGQILNDPPDEEYFRKQAREFGYDEETYIQALRKVNIIPDSQIKPVMEFYAKLGQVLAAIGLQRLRKIEAAEDRFSKAFHCSPSPITITTLKEGYYIEVNDAWVKHTGYTRSDAIGKTGVELGIWAREPERIRWIEQLRDLGNVVNYRAVFRMKSGIIRNYLVSAELVEMNQEKCIICVHNDITDQIQAEQALRHSEEKFSKVFHGSPIMMTLSSLQESKILDANEAFCRGMGYIPNEIIGRPIPDEMKIVAKPDNKQDLDKGLYEEGELEGAQIDFRTKSGEIRHGMLWGQLLYLNDKLCRMTSLIDITEQKRIEQEMARLSDLNLIGEMAASIGHEIRNPMTSVRGFLQLFKEKYAEDGEFLDLMIEELDRANSIISEVLGMAKNKVVYLQPQYIDQIVKNIYPMLEADANYRGIKITLELGKPPMPVIDQNEIRQVILNLARNGLEAMESGGTLTIGTTVEKGEIVLYVKDEGPGLKREYIDKIGTPFFTTKENGTGLGLAVCYSIAARHKARLEFESSPRGTTFKMRFRAHKED
jgi:PAS domain S-box